MCSELSVMGVRGGKQGKILLFSSAQEVNYTGNIIEEVKAIKVLINEMLEGIRN